MTIVLNVGAVSDKVGRKLAAGAFATYTPYVPNTAPKFADGAAPENLPLGICRDDSLPYMVDEDGDLLDVILPLAIDTEDERNLRYELWGETPSGDTSWTIPNAKRAEGFYWETTDAQTRILKGKARLDDGGKYRWTVYDSQGAFDSITFSIKVEEHQKPNKPETPAAVKKDAAATAGQSVDQVVLTWNQPSADEAKAERAYPNCIPAVTGYTVTETMWHDVSQEFVSSATYASDTGTTYADRFIAPEEGTLWTFTTPKTGSRYLQVHDCGA